MGESKLDAEKMRIGIIGAGPGGYIAALSAARYGAKVTLIEKGGIGGTCLQKGCIPTKTLYRSRQMVEWAQNAATFGVHVGRVSYDVPAILRRKEMLVHVLADSVHYLLKSGNVELVRGNASFLDSGHVRISGETEQRILEADAFIVATGSRSKAAPFPVEGNPTVIAAEEILNMERLPGRIIIVGGGAVGVEIAAIYNTFGVNVTLVERENTLLPGMDEEVVNYLRRELEKQGVKIYLSSRIEKVSGSAKRCRVLIRDENGHLEEALAEMVLLAAGRQGNTEGLDLQRTGAGIKDGFLIVNENLETAAKGIYAIGDVIGDHMLAHAASRQGELLAEQLMTGKPKTLKLTRHEIPHCIFSLPEVAVMGYSEKEAVLAGYPVAVGRFPFSANGKAFIDGSYGFVKVVINQENQEILGIHMVGQEASTLIGEAALAVTRHMKVEEVTDVIYPHPTLSETLREACLSAVGKAFHITNLSGMSYDGGGSLS